MQKHNFCTIVRVEVIYTYSINLENITFLETQPSRYELFTDRSLRIPYLGKSH